MSEPEKCLPGRIVATPGGIAAPKFLVLSRIPLDVIAWRPVSLKSEKTQEVVGGSSASLSKWKPAAGPQTFRTRFGLPSPPYAIAEWQRRTNRKWKENLPPWIYEAWHFILSRDLDFPSKPPSWLKQPAVMEVPITTPQVLSRLGTFKDDLRPFTVVTVPFPKRETVADPLWKGYFIMPHAEKLNDLHGRTMVNIVSGETFHIYDKNSSRLPKPRGWLSLRTMEDEINHIQSRAESKFCAPNGHPCTSRTLGLLKRRHIVAGEFHYFGKEASTRWGSGVDLSMLAEAGALDPADETFRKYERVVDPKYMDEIRAQAKQFSTKRLSRQARLAEDTIRKFKNGKNTIRPRSLRKVTRAIHDLQNKRMKRVK